MKKIISLFFLIIFIATTLTQFAYSSAENYPKDCGSIGISTRAEASVRISENSGLRFKTNIAKALISDLSSKYGDKNISVGTLIAPLDLLGGKTLTHENGTANIDYIDVIAELDTPFESFSDYNVYAGSIINIKQKNLTRQFIAVGYLKIFDGNNYSYIYSNETATKTASYVANLAYRDVNNTLILDIYPNVITDPNDDYIGKYSPYTSSQRTTIRSLIATKHCTHSYDSNITPPSQEQNGSTTYLCKLCGNTYSVEKAEIALQYDDYVTAIGDIKAASKAITFEGDDCLEIVTKNNVTYFRAKDVGTVVVCDGTNTERVTVNKAKLHFIVVMGQSNAGNHFANAVSDVVCPIGTAYLMSSASTAPVLYTNTSMGLHTPLVAEFRAQSVAAGAPQKPVLIWKEGATSKNGNPITSWATSATETSGTDATVKMIEECTKYFTAPERADKYEIVQSGMYWLQGEGGADPIYYKECFMAMWGRLKDAGIDYCAFFRVRRGVSFNKTVTDHNDLSHHGALRAQMEMINENNDMYLATDITENWIGLVEDKHSINISNYITMMEFYGKSESYTDNLGNKATFKNGILTTTMKELYGENNWCHYGKFGYGIIGADAAYNMYRALYGNSFAVVASDTSGLAVGGTRTISLAGQSKSIDITNLSNDLVFVSASGSTSGHLKVSVLSNGVDITTNNGVIISSGDHFGAISVAELKNYSNVSIVVTYTTKTEACKPITYTIIQ